jgi:hypothetical protein
MFGNEKAGEFMMDIDELIIPYGAALPAEGTLAIDTARYGLKQRPPKIPAGDLPPGLFVFLRESAVKYFSPSGAMPRRDCRKEG